MTSVDGGQGINGVNNDEYVFTISKEGGDISNRKRIDMRAVIIKALTEVVTSDSEHNPFKQLASDVKKLEINERQKKIRSEEKELENRLLNSLKEIIITLATFFIYFISFLGSFQQSSQDHICIIVVAVLVVVIWLFTVLLVIIGWSELKDIKVEINTLEGRGGKYLPKWHLCRALVVIFGLVVTGFSVYFAYILHTQWLSGSSPAPSPSALPTFQLPSTVPLTTQDYAASQ